MSALNSGKRVMRTTFKTELTSDPENVYEGSIAFGPEPNTMVRRGWIPNLNPDNVAPGLIVLTFHFPAGSEGTRELWAHASNLRRMERWSE